MQHDAPLIATLVAALGLAFLFGVIAQRSRLSPLFGYLIAGIAIGPFTPGYVADQDLASELSEIGVILLMFGVGLHFSPSELHSVRAIAIPGALGQIVIATMLGMALAVTVGWSITSGVIFGLALSVASTVVLLRALQERGLIESERGRIAVGWLIVEDVLMVLALVLISTLSSASGEASLHPANADLFTSLLGPNTIWGIMAVTIAKLAAFVASMLIVGRNVVPWVLHFTAHTGSRELFRLAVLVIALGIAYGSTRLFGVSLALGAFFAGMMLAESVLGQQAARETLPLRDAFAVLFFVSVGMLFNPAIIAQQPVLVLATVLIIIVGKSVAAFLIVLAFRYPLGTALTISVSLAQIGEFSFILAVLGVTLGLLSNEARDLIFAGALISILCNPPLFLLLDRLTSRLSDREEDHRPSADDAVIGTSGAWHDAFDRARAELDDSSNDVGPDGPQKGA